MVLPFENILLSCGFPFVWGLPLSWAAVAGLAPPAVLTPHGSESSLAGLQSFFRGRSGKVVWKKLFDGTL